MAATSLSLVIALCFTAEFVQFASGTEFLKAPKAVIEHISKEDIRTSLLDEIEGALGAGSAANRLSQMEALLKPIFAALPKNEHGRLGHTAVAYALHRLFVLRHGWVIKGLASSEGGWNSSSPASVLSDQVPSYVEALFEERLAGNGLGLNEVAVMAATIEHLIHNEAVGRLGNAFNVHSLPFTSPLSDTDADAALDTYMMSYILGENLGNLTLHLRNTLIKSMDEIFLAWGDTQKFVRATKKNVTEDAGEVDFASLAKVVDVVGEQFGSFQDLECRQLKDKLLKMEYRGTGRVKLADFYRPALNGAWTFQESTGYLRSLGVLDESDPTQQPSVIIANYVTSQANCIASSGFYEVCCKNECEGLLGHLETQIGASEAKPDVISSIVAKLPSSTTVAAQKLSASLRQRLEDIAATHNGKVPLHGRLFAQWMHHIYPRECPFPHVSGTVASDVVDMIKNGEEARATEEEMMQFIAESAKSPDSDATHDLPVEEISPWSPEEELFVVHSSVSPVSTGSSMTSSMRSLVLFAAAGSLGLTFVQALKITPQQGIPKKYTV